MTSCPWIAARRRPDRRNREPGRRGKRPATAGGVAGVGIACILSAMLTGCYTFAPVPLESVSAGDQVRVRLSVEGRDRLERDLFVERRLLEGTLESLGDGRLVLDVPWAVREDGFHSERLVQQVDLRRQEYLEIEQKTIDGLRTGLVIVGVGAGVGVVAGRMLAGDTGGNTGGSGPGPAETLIFRIPFSLR